MKLLDALAGATETDLVQIEARKKELENELRSLTLLQRVLARKFGKAQENKPGPKANTEKKSKGGEMIQRLRTSAALVLAREGAMTGAALARRLDVSDQDMSRAMQHEWFEKGERGWYLTPVGKQANC